DGRDGRTLYLFGDDDHESPYVAVEDGVGDGTDPTPFPHLFRVAYYRNGYVRLYVLTQSGDTVSTWTSPDPDTWRQALPDVKGWQEGKVEPLPPFAPPVDASGRLNPGRILVVRFAPQREQPAGGATWWCWSATRSGPAPPARPPAASAPSSPPRSRSASRWRASASSAASRTSSGSIPTTRRSATSSWSPTRPTCAASRSASGCSAAWGWTCGSSARPRRA